MTAVVRGLVIALATFCVTAQAGTIYVSTSGSDSATGQSWATAKKTVQAGLNAAQSGDQVWVAAGTYVQCITLQTGVALYGGFAGTETDLSQRNWVTNVTILDGNQVGSVVTAPSGATQTTRIDGFTIRNGSGALDYYGDIHGGGIYCSGASPTITNNTITGNTTAGDGGGIYCMLSSSPAIVGNVIMNNAGSNGGGICCDSSSPMISNNTIRTNTANYDQGGGIYCHYSPATIVNNTICGNGAEFIGGGVYAEYSALKIINNTIVGNTSNGGGGVYLSSCPQAVVANTIIASNSSGISAAGIQSLRNNCVYGNVSYNYASGTDPTGTNGNISVDPRLADVSCGNPHIQPDSPCIDAGDDTAVQPGWTDIDGQSRIISAHVDIGADESDGTTWPTGLPAIVRVSMVGDDANDGSSWDRAKRTVQAGIDAAASAGGEVWVQAGTYVECITLRNYALTYGGFAGTEVQRSQRDWSRNLSILDGNKTGSVVTAVGVGAGTCTIDGFVIRNGQADGLGWDPSGGGISCAGSFLTITNNTITGNDASSGYGGGISCCDASPTITNNKITGNKASYGGAIYCGYWLPNPVIAPNEISGNQAGQGGGIYIDDCVPTVTDNTIVGNTATNSGLYNEGGGGGIYCLSTRSPVIANNVISGNSTRSSGGGVYCRTGSITGNQISGNSAAGGGGVHCGSSSSATIANNRITDNWVIAGTNGSSNYYGGGILCASSSSARIVNNTIVGNYSTVTFLGSIIGTGIYSESSSITIANTIVAFNSSGIYASGKTCRYNCVFGNSLGNYYSIAADPTGTNGNISVDPLLADGKYRNVHLQPGSPCIDAGDNSMVQAGWLDIDGQPRIINGAVDIGADESDGTVWASGPNTIVRVSPTGSDANDGSSWPKAKKTVQAAIDAVNLVGGEVWVQAGTYNERITLRNYAYVYGGFAGTETQRSERDWSSRVTILDGNQGGSVITANWIGNGWGTIDGFTIRNGKAVKGGGIYCVRASPTISNNIITANSAVDTSPIGTAAYGGAIYCDGSSSVIADNMISNNSTRGRGAGIYATGSSLTISDNTITGHTQGEGAVWCQGGSLTITGNKITANSYAPDTLPSSGIHCDGGSALVADNTITGNSGCGIESWNNTTRLTAVGNLIAGNGDAGVDYSCSSTSRIVATGNVIVGNGDGGVRIYRDASASFGGSASLMNNTIAGNASTGVACNSIDVTMANTIVAFNASGVNVSGTAALRCNCVFGNTTYNFSGLADPTGTNGNISADPRLANLLFGNLHIQPDSPCVDAGDDSVVDTGSRDVDGQARILGAHVDIGAYESDGTLWPTGAPAVVRVRPTGDDASDGSSWDLAKRTVQAGIDAVTAGGGEVWVQEGTYQECITLGNYVHIYGGFAGTETQRLERDFSTRVTTLDGNRGGSVVTVTSGGYRLSTVDGFAIRNGTGTVRSSSTFGGGVYCRSAAPTIANNTIASNSALYGGAICCYYPATIAHNMIVGNSASGGKGGGILCGNVDVSTIIGNRIIGNTAASGGGIWAYGDLQVADNVIAGNTAVTGAGLYLGSSRPYVLAAIISNDTIVGNTTTDSSGQGGGIYFDAGTSPTITNTLLAFNSSGIYKTGSEATSLSYNCIFGNTAYNFSGLTDPTNTNGNISFDPLLVRLPNPGPDGVWGTADDDYGDLHLQLGSPCINAGDPAYVAAPGETDMDGQPRVIGGRVDIGADEYCLTGDANYDGYVNVGDLQLLIAAWGTRAGDAGYNTAADVNADGCVNIGDLQLLVAHWAGSM